MMRPSLLRAFLALFGLAPRSRGIPVYPTLASDIRADEKREVPPEPSASLDDAGPDWTKLVPPADKDDKSNP